MNSENPDNPVPVPYGQPRLVDPFYGPLPVYKFCIVDDNSQFKLFIIQMQLYQAEICPIVSDLPF